MAELSFPQIGADQISKVIRHELGRAKNNAVNERIRQAKERSRDFQDLPPRLEKLLVSFPKIKSLLLKVYNRITLNQRYINLLFADSVAELVALQQQNQVRIIQLEGEIAVQSRLIQGFQMMNENQIAEQKLQISAIRHEATQRFAGSSSRLASDRPDAQKVPQIAPPSIDLDQFYSAFETKFRGDPLIIKDRLAYYLPFVANIVSNTKTAGIVDVGCGRGEWIELLNQCGYSAYGIDTSSVAVQECKDKGLKVLLGDSVAHLEAVPENSLGVVTGFHIIEHLPFDVLLRLFKAAHRALARGGMIIFETPNPGNILVGSNSFYLDPTHRNPLPAPFTEFLAQFSGFGKVKIEELHSYPESYLLKGSELAERFNQYFYCGQDYAVLGYKV